MNLFDRVGQDARYALRSLRRTPAVAAAVVLSFGLVIGFAMAVLAVGDGIYLRRLALPHAEELASIERYGRRVDIRYSGLRDLVTAAGVPAIAAYRLESAAVAVGAGPAEGRWVDLVSGNYFDVLGVRARVGRTLTAADERVAAPVAVISERFRDAHFVAGENPIGAVLHVNDLALTVVGVLPESFTGVHFARQLDVAAPITVSPSGWTDVGRLGVKLVARVPRPSDRTAAVLRAALEHCCLSPIPSGNEPPRRQGAISVGVPDGPVGDQGEWFSGAPNVGPPITFGDASRGLTWSVDYRGRYARAMVIAIAAAVLLVLVGCANVAVLLAARGETREREFAVRLALGASRRRLAHQLLVEAGELVTAGGILGLAIAMLVARWAIRQLVVSTGMDASALLGWAEWRVGAAAGITVLLSTILVTVWPARRAGRASLLAALAGDVRRFNRRWSVERLLIVAQGASAVVLAVTAVLFMATVHALIGSNGGYDSRDVLLARVDIRDAFCTGSNYIGDLSRCYRAEGQDASRLARYELAMRALQRVPGVSGVAATFNAPVMQDAAAGVRLRIVASNEALSSVRMSFVGGRFFAVTGIGMMAGRDFEARDGPASERVAIVSEAFARHHFGQVSPINQTIAEMSAKGERIWRVVGVARDAAYDPMSSGTPDLRHSVMEMVYVPFAQRSPVWPIATIVVRTSPRALHTLNDVRGALQEIPGLHLARLVSAGELLDSASTRERLSAALFSGAGALALALVAIGLFAVLQYAVSRRAREIGIRMTLGAVRSDIVRLVLVDALAMSAAAILIGVPAALAVSQTLRGHFCATPRLASPETISRQRAVQTSLCMAILEVSRG